LHLETGSLSPGLYFAVIRGDEQTLARKIIVLPR